MKKFAACLAAGALCLAAAPAFSSPSVFPTGTTIYNPDEAFNGYTLVSVDWDNLYSKIDNREFFPPNPDFTKPVPASPRVSDKVLLIDMNGNVVHQWKDLGRNKKVQLLPNGHILSISEHNSAVIEYDWDGNVVWEYKTRLQPHHDGRRLANGNTLILCYETIPREWNEKHVENVTSPWFGTQDRRNMDLRGDYIIEVTPEGKMVWDWASSEHLAEYANVYNPIYNLKDWTHGNTVSIIPENKWYDAGDKRFKPGNILFNPRHFDMCMIIDKDSKEIVWKLENFKPVGGLGNSHEPVMIPKGYPGEGNIMIFDNALFNTMSAHIGQSMVWEVDPSTIQVVWRYAPAQTGNTRFFSKFKGASYKLPNGNVLISEDYAGRVFQVKPDPTHPDGGTIVWEYQHDSVISRTSAYPYDYCPQMKGLSRSEERVTPPDPGYWKILPDSMRRNGVLTILQPE